MSEGSRGWIGSLVVHAVIVGALVGASWVGAHQSDGTLDAVDPLIVDLNGIIGRKPGEVGRDPGVAKGQATGSRLFKGKSVDMSKVNEKPSAPDAGGASGSNRARTSATGAKSSSGARETLDNFNRSRGTGRGTGSGATGGVSGVALGRSNGTGDNGGDGGTATAQQMYAGEVLARFRQAWADVVTTEGEDLGAFQCGVKVAVSASGNVVFSGYINEPSSPKAKALIRRAVGQIGNCGRPPDGKGFEINFPSVSTSEGG